MGEKHTIPEGMKRWGGGNAAPADWDGGMVFIYDDSAEPGYQYDLAARHFGEGGECWQRNNPYVDIIAYTSTTPTDTKPAGEGDAA